MMLGRRLAASSAKKDQFLFCGSNNTAGMNVYPFDVAKGIGAKMADPTSLLPGLMYDVKLNARGTALIVAHNYAPQMTAYVWSAGGYGAKYANPATLPPSTGHGRNIFFTPNEDAVILMHSVTPFLQAWAWSETSGFGAKFTDPASLTGQPNYAAFSPDGKAIAITHNVAPYVSVYAWSAAGFGAKYPNPATAMPNGAGISVAFSPDSKSIVISHTATPFIHAYAWDSVTGFGAKLPNPATLPNTYARNFAFNPKGTVLAMSTEQAAPWARAWRWSAQGFGPTYANPATALGGGWSVGFSPNNDAIAIGQWSGTPAASTLSVYGWSDVGGWGSRYANPAIMPTGNATGCYFGVTK